MIKAPRCITFFSEKALEDYLNANTFPGLNLFVIDHGGRPTLISFNGDLP